MLPYVAFDFFWGFLEEIHLKMNLTNTRNTKRSAMQKNSIINLRVKSNRKLKSSAKVGQFIERMANSYNNLR